MLPNKFEMPLDLVVRPSKLFQYYLVSLALLSFLSFIIPTSLPLSLRLLLFVAILLLVLGLFKRQKSYRVTAISLNSECDWKIEVNKKNYDDVELTGECIVTSFLIWLNFKIIDSEGEKKLFHILLLNDSADKNLMRQLRVRLRFLTDKTAEKNKDDADIVMMK